MIVKILHVILVIMFLVALVDYVNFRNRGDRFTLCDGYILYGQTSNVDIPSECFEKPTPFTKVIGQ